MEQPVTNNQRATEILDALIQQTAQQDYDEETVDKLIEEYERLMAD